MSVPALLARMEPSVPTVLTSTPVNVLKVTSCIFFQSFVTHEIQMNLDVLNPSFSLRLHRAALRDRY